MKKGRSFGKRAAALLAGILTLFGSGGLSASAAEISTAALVAFPRSGDAVFVYSEDVWGHPAKSYLGGWADPAAEEMMIHAADSANGTAVYCIEPGAARRTGDTFTASGEEFWDRYPSSYNPTIPPETIRDLIGRILHAGYQGKVSTSWRSQNSADADKLAHIMATQVLIWETVVGERDASFSRVSPGQKDAVRTVVGRNNPIYEAFIARYEQMEREVRSYTTVPTLFSSDKSAAGTVELKPDGSGYSASVTDLTGSLAGFAFSSDDPAVTFSVSGNTLTVRASSAPEGTVTVTALKELERSGILVWTDGITDPKRGLQDTVTAVGAKPDPVTAYLKAEVRTGSLTVVKSSEDGKVSGLSFTVKGGGISESGKTGADGRLTFSDLPAGSYTLTEETPSAYEPAESRTVTVAAGEETRVSFSNTLKKGELRIVKKAEDGLAAGARFRVTGTSLSGERIDRTAEADSTGTARFRDLPVGSGYTVEEVGTPVRYVLPDAQTASVDWDAVTEKTFSNRLKKFRVSAVKKDAETGGRAQGDGSLAGAVYGLYRNGTLMGRYTTGEDGSFDTEEFPCGDGWTIRELSPSEGYLLDETEHKIGAKAETFTVEHNTIGLSLNETVVKERVRILKHSDSGATGVDTPEPGAVFELFLSSAGSYEKALPEERDLLTTDEEGEALSKELPYGTYTLRQVDGAEGTERIGDLSLSLQEDGKTVRLLLNNAPYEGYLKVVKTDAETGRTIPVEGAGFQITAPDGSKVRMVVTYPVPTVLDTFFTGKDGTLVTPEKLPLGRGYLLTEVQAPAGYRLKETPVSFDVTEETGPDGTVTVVLEDLPQKGIVKIVKRGEVFSSVLFDGERYLPVYEEKGLPGAVFEIRAKEEIRTPDGTLRLSAGEPAGVVVTGEDGTGESGELFLGRYEITEVKAPAGTVLSSEPMTAVLSYAGQEAEFSFTELSVRNERQRAEVRVKKELETDERFGITDTSFSSVRFSLFAGEDLTAADGSVIPEDGLLAEAVCGPDGTAVFDCDLPAGVSCRILETGTGPNYLLSEERITGAFEPKEGDGALTVLCPGKPVFNRFVRGRIEGKKTDPDGKGLAGALVGLFRSSEAVCSEENALLTAVSGLDGSFSFEGVPFGEWKVRELQAPAGYRLCAEPASAAVVKDGETVSVTIVNEQKKGSLLVRKDSEDGVLEGFTFLVKGVTEAGEVFTAEKTTGKDGTALFEEIPAGRVTVTEVYDDQSGRYLIPGPVETEVRDGETAEVSFLNRLRPVPDNPKTGEGRDRRIAAIAAAAALAALSGAVLLKIARKRRKGKKDDR